MSALEVIFRGVLEISWRSSWLIVAVFAWRALLRGRLTARVVFWAWIAVAIRLLLPVALPATWSPFNLAPFSHASTPAIVTTTEAGRLPPIATGPSTSAISEAATLSANEVARFSSLKKLTFTQWMALIWGAGVLALLLARLFAYHRFVRALQRSRTAPSPELAAQLAAAAARQPGFQRIKISVTEVVRAPALHGIMRPELLFPPGFIAQLTSRELQLIVAHELAHDRRRDLLAQVLIHGAVILHWFNPLAWIVAGLSREDCELACDEFVLRRLAPTERESYGATLLKIIRLTRCSAPPPLALGVVESKQQIKRRIQMIIAHPSSTVIRTVLGCALFSFVTGLSLTSEIRAQPQPAVTESRVEAPRKIAPTLDESQWKFAYNSSTDRLGTLFPNGTVATVGDRVITIEDVRREIRPLVPQLQREARDQEEFNLKINRLQNNVIRTLVGRILLIKEFHIPATDGNARHIPASYIDNEIANRIKGQFDNDRSKLLAYLQTRGLTLDAYRHEIEEEIIYHYMEGQERKLTSNPDAKKTKTGGTEGKMHLRLIQLTRSADATDAALLEKANAILVRFKNGESFEALAREFSGDSRRDKGGDWGWMSPNELKPEYSERAFALKKGEASAPILMSEGCFLLYAEDRR